MKRVASLLLALVMFFSLSSQVVAASIEYAGNDAIGEEVILNTGMNEAEIEEFANKAFNYLTPEQQNIYIFTIEQLALMGDYTLVEFHKKYVDPSYNFSQNSVNGISPANSAVAYSATDIASQLQALNLPATVYNGLIALSAALAVPVGNVVDLVIGLGLAAIIVANWDTISSKWDEIVDIFVDAFGSTVMEAFYYLQGLVGVYTVVISGKTITVNNDEYRCTTKADIAAATMEKKGHSYYPAVVSGGAVWVAPIDIPRKVALAIMKENSHTAGVFTVTGNLARSLCESLGGAKGPESHGSGGDYWYHYHGRNYLNAHCWYIF